MNRKVLGNVTFDEVKEIKKLNNRKLSLINIKKTIAISSEDIKNQFCKKIEGELAEATNSVDEWWRSINIKYNWNTKNSRYIEFDTGIVWDEYI